MDVDDGRPEDPEAPLAWEGEDDDDLEEALDAWRRIDRRAVRVLQEALLEYRGAPAPLDEIERAAARLRQGYAEGTFPFHHLEGAVAYAGSPPSDPVEVVLDAAGAYVDPLGDPGFDESGEEAVFSLEHADWLGAVVELVRSGPGTPVDPELLVEYVDRCPEVEEPIGIDEEEAVEMGFAPVVDGWQAAGVVDEGGRLTPLGVWVLPRALARAWDGDFDGPIVDEEE